MKKLSERLLILVMCFAMTVNVLGQTLPIQLWITDENDSRPVLLTGNPNENQLIPVTKQEESVRQKYHIHLRYPQLTAEHLSLNAQRFNQMIKTIVKTQLNDFKDQLSSSIAKTFPADARSDFKLNYQLASFVSQKQQTQYVSIRFNIDRYTLGMAHPAHSTLTMNYDLGHHQILSLADLFLPHVNYLTAIAADCEQQLQSKPNLDISMIKEGTTPTVEHYKNWNLTLSGLLITFDEAQVAPRVNGQQQVLIPYALLSKQLNQQALCTLGVVRCDPT